MLYFDFKRELAELDRIWRNHLHFLTFSRTLFTYSLQSDKGAGITSLIKAYLKKNPDAYYVSLAGGHEIALENFRAACFPNSEPAKNWEDAFSKAAAALKGKPVMIFLDDLDAVEQDDELWSAYRKFTDSHRPILVVDAGSRLNMKWREEVFILPRTLADFCKALPGHSRQDIARLYAVTGGVLPAMKELDGNICFEENLLRLLQHDSSFSQYVPTLLREAFRTPESYYPILYSISQGKHRLSEIAAAIGFPNNKCGKYLEALIDAGFVISEKPSEGKHSTYYLKNSYLNFWFNYIYKNRTLQVSDPERLLSLVLETLDERIVMPAVLECCIRYMRNSHKGEHYFLFDQFDRTKNTPVPFKSRDGYTGQFDCVFMNDEGTLLCVFPKNLDDRFTKKDLEHYLETAKQYGSPWFVQLMVFSLHRFSDWCVHRASQVPLLFEISAERMRY